ncbi:MAG: phospholipase D family protein, partial [Chloroflexota bacterium]|nr:phospholipase D family protein [Chloroflexota bacterium]
MLRGVVLGRLVARFARFPRFLFGRFHRRRRHRHVRQQPDRHRPAGQWWSADRRWFPGGFPPRERNALAPHIDGRDAFGAVLDAARGAESYVYIAGWALTPTFALHRPGGQISLDGLLTGVLREVSERVPVKILVWSGSAFLFQPSKRRTKHACDELQREAPRVDIRLDNRARATHSHHQKMIVVDGQVGFVGGLDLTTLEGDRWDEPGHPLRYGLNWHDVELEVRGEAVADLEANFTQRWEAVTGERDLPHRAPAIDPAWRTPCQVVRTIPRRTYPFAPRGEFGIAHAYLSAIAGAKRFIYLENQYLWSADIVDALTEAMDRNTKGDGGDGRFRIVIVLPARADYGKYDNDQHVDLLREADGGRGIFSAYSLYSSGPASGPYGVGFRPVYVHAKVAVIDDEWYTVGSANLNRRGLAKDTEINVQAIDPEGARALRLRLWAEHLRCDIDEIADTDPSELIDTVWPRRAAEVEQIIKDKRGIPPALVHPYDTSRAPGTWLLQEAQALFEGL